MQLPACALTTPQKAPCRTPKPLATHNDVLSSTLTATVAVTNATVLAATAGNEGPGGDYKATPKAAGSWSARKSTGAFAWSYPIDVPDVPGNMEPKISLDYSSESVDGLTAASNNQASWIGDGWSWEPGFVQRRYKSCNDDKTDATDNSRVGDLCWCNDNALSRSSRAPPTATKAPPTSTVGRALEDHHDRRHPVLLRTQPAPGLERSRHGGRRPGDQLDVDHACLRQPGR
ncbi:hypothetical protein ACWGH3_38135 [Streptomyces sp. NPDC054884]|uniref:hypothetical protein n=1 Tax=unclassified Streptomyces TaxID=2593676 RepID=UPI0029B6CFB4|nr:hypothetical protein [Streptomyces sp. ME08-AFT2]MDX3312077.1 hypothetical protein [Streptomyces sp. ME08-AFT2]